MPDWLQLVVMLAGPGISGYVGVKAGLSVMRAQMDDARAEIKALREAKHEHAGFLTQHELRIESLERKVDPR